MSSAVQSTELRQTPTLGNPGALSPLIGITKYFTLAPNTAAPALSSAGIGTLGKVDWA